jgi:hypothetical protein
MNDDCSILKLLTGFGQLAIAAVVAYIVFQQWRTAHAKYRFDLYEKRFKIYQAVLDFIGNIVCDEIDRNQVVCYDIACQEAFFLFAEDVALLEYLTSLRKKGGDYNSLKSQAQDIPGEPNPQRTELTNQMNQIKDWFFQQPDVVKRKFARHISFR